MVKPKSGDSPRVIAALPAFNEEKYIGSVVLRTRQYVDEVIVVDDGSTDHTVKVAELAGAIVIRHEQNKGYGASIQTILAEAKKRKPDILVLLDADHQHNPDDIPQLIKPISDGYDLVIGSRGEQKGDIPFYRQIGVKVISRFSHVLSRHRLADSESGFRVFSSKAIAKLELKENGMSVSAETIADASGKGLRITEESVFISYTGDGSTLNPVSHGVGVLIRILVMISERRPLFFFGLGGIIMVVVGLIIGIRVVNDVYSGGVVAVGSALVSSMLVTLGLLSMFTGIILNAISKH